MATTRKKPKARRASLGFDPNSYDSQFSKLNTILEEHGEKFDRIFDCLDKIVKPQLQEIQGKWKYAVGWATGAAAVVSIAMALLFHFWPKG